MTSWASNQEVEDVFGNRQTLGGPIGFCFIDGHQDYEYSFRDWENTERFLVSGGYVLLDDSADRWESGRRKVAGEIMKNKDYELVFKNPNYLFRKK